MTKPTPNYTVDFETEEGEILLIIKDLSGNTIFTEAVTDKVLRVTEEWSE